MTTYGNWPELLGIAGAVVVAGWLIYWVYRAKLLEREERRLMIEHGMTPPAPVPQGWPAVRAREQELRYEERRLLIEKGMDPGGVDVDGPNPFVKVVLPKDRVHSLHRGLVTVAAGLGLLAPYAVIRLSGAIVSEDTMNFALLFAAIGPFVTLYGIANVLYYALTKNTSPRPVSPSSPDSRSGS